MKRHFKSALALFMPLLVVSCLTISSALILSSSGSTAIETEAITTTVKVLEACSMTANPDSTDTAHSAEMIGGTVENSIGVTTIDVTCNDFNGYSVYAVGYGNNTEGNTDLTGAVTGQTIPTGTNMTTSVSNWAMRLTAVDDSTNYFVPTILSDANGSFAENHAVPSNNTKVVTFQNAIDVSKPSRFTTTYAAAVTPYQVADTYTGQVKYTLVHPNYADAAGEVGKYYMQDLNSTVLANLLPNVNNTIIVYDKRDEQPYKIAKLADGKYWMVENLNLAGGTTITSADSDVISDFTLPESSETGFNDNTKVDGFVYNTGKRTSDCTNGCYSYYSYNAATAGTGASISGDGYNAPSSICPKGWRLPTATLEGVSRDSGGYTGGDFYQMILAETGQSSLANGYYESTANFYTNAGPGTTPGFLLTGRYYNSAFGNGGESGYYWSSTSKSGANAYFSDFYSSGVYSASYSVRWLGFPVRCVFDHEDMTDITTMQEMTPTIAAYTPQGTTATLTDSRGGVTKSYTVAKLADNKVWMTSNLDLPGGTTLSQSDSNLNGSTTSYTLRASSTSGFNDYTTGWVYNSSSTYNDTSCGNNNPCYSYYSYPAATAGTNPASAGDEASSDICPYGWRLPTDAEYNTLVSSYNTAAKLIASPFYGVYSGRYTTGSFYDGGSHGQYWSSTSFGSDLALSLYFDSSSAYLGSSYKRSGFAVRCVAKS